jgi:glycosyltransferase involved in cell wall biosynthesis
MEQNDSVSAVMCPTAAHPLETTSSAIPELEGCVEVSVVMPCLNEAQTVGRCVTKAIQALREMNVLGEVIVADNGSTDSSQLVAKIAGARVVSVAVGGYGAALLGGIAAARGRFVIMGDSDFSYDFSRIEGFVEKLRSGDELVVGNRFRGGIEPGAMPWHHRYFGNPLLSGLLNLLFHTPVGDAHCGLRAVRKEAFYRLRLVTTGMEFASEMIVKARLTGLRISEVPIVLHPDGRNRPPHLRSFRDGWRHLRLLLRLAAGAAWTRVRPPRGEDDSIGLNHRT